MQQLLYIAWVISLVVELTWPLWLMAVRWRWPKLMPFWWMCLLIVFGGWVLANAQVHLRLAYLDVIVQRMEDPDLADPIVMEWIADGGKMLFAAIFGCVYGLVIALVWSPVLVIAEFVRRRRTRAIAATGSWSEGWK